MRIGALRVWLATTVAQGFDQAKRVGRAISRKIKEASGRVDVGVGVGDDESRFGGGRSRVWLEVLEEYREKLLRIFERSYFERFPRLERLVRRFLGGTTKQRAPELPKPASSGPRKLGAHTPGVSNDEYQAQIRLGMMQAHTREHAGLRDRVARLRSDDQDAPVELDDEGSGDHAPGEHSEERDNEESEADDRSPPRDDLVDL